MATLATLKIRLAALEKAAGMHIHRRHRAKLEKVTARIVATKKEIEMQARGAEHKGEG